MLYLANTTQYPIDLYSWEIIQLCSGVSTVKVLFMMNSKEA